MVRKVVSTAATRGHLHQIKARSRAQGWESFAGRSIKKMEECKEDLREVS